MKSIWPQVRISFRSQGPPVAWSSNLVWSLQFLMVHPMKSRYSEPSCCDLIYFYIPAISKYWDEYQNSEMNLYKISKSSNLAVDQSGQWKPLTDQALPAGGACTICGTWLTPGPESPGTWRRFQRWNAGDLKQNHGDIPSGSINIWLICGWCMANMWLICGWLICGWYVVNIWLICGWYVVNMWLICG